MLCVSCDSGSPTAWQIPVPLETGKAWVCCRGSQAHTNSAWCSRRLHTGFWQSEWHLLDSRATVRFRVIGHCVGDAYQFVLGLSFYRQMTVDTFCNIALIRLLGLRVNCIDRLTEVVKASRLLNRSWLDRRCFLCFHFIWLRAFIDYRIQFGSLSAQCDTFFP